MLINVKSQNMILFILDFVGKAVFHFLNLLACSPPVLCILPDVHDDLFKNQDDDQVLGNAVEVLAPVRKQVVGDVRIDELEHVDLVDQGVFVLVFVLVVLSIGQKLTNLHVELPEKDYCNGIEAETKFSEPELVLIVCCVVHFLLPETLE